MVVVLWVPAGEGGRSPPGAADRGLLLGKLPAGLAKIAFPFPFFFFSFLILIFISSLPPFN